MGFFCYLLTSEEDGLLLSTWPAALYSDWDPYRTEMYGDLVLSEEPPLTTIALEGDEGENGWFVGEVEVTLAATGGMASVENIWYNLDDEGWQTYDAPFTVAGDGVHTVEYYSDDTDGNEEPVRTAKVMIDLAPPVISADIDGAIGGDGWLVSNASVTFTVTDSASGLAFVRYQLDGGDWVEMEDNELVVMGEGPHTIAYCAVDVAGHECSVQELELRIDTVSPVTTAAIDGSTVTLTAVDDTSGYESTMYRIDSGDWVAYDGPFEVRGGGDHTVEFFSTDVAGNNESIKSIDVEGAAVFSLLGMDGWLVLLAGAIVAAVAAGAVMGLRRMSKARSGPQEEMPPPDDEPAPQYDEEDAQPPEGQQ